MRAVDELIEKAKRLSAEARRELRDKLDELLKEEGPEKATIEGPYGTLLELAGSAHAHSSDVARNKNKHLGDAYATKRKAK